MENDRVPDAANIFEDATDKRTVDATDDMDIPVAVQQTGAIWVGQFRLFRLSKSVTDQLKDHQIELVNFILDAWVEDRGVLAAHTMGLGKSLSFLVALSSYLYKYPDKRAVVVAPLSMVQVWMDETYKWDGVIDNIFPHLITSKMDDQAVQRAIRDWYRRGNLLIVGHDHFKKVCKDLPLSGETIVAVDEAHLLKSPSTQFYAVIKDLPTNRRVFLTGSPLQNHLTEYYAMIELLASGLLGANISEFNKLYGKPINDGMLRDSTDEQISKCERTVQVLRWRIENIMNEKSAALLRSTIPSKLEVRVPHPSDAVDQAPDWIQERNNVHSAARPYKIMATITIIDAIQACDPSDAIIVFSNRIDTLNAIRGNRPGFLFTGAVTSEARITIIDEFNKDGGIIYLTTKAGGVGINLTRANHVIITDLAWNPVDDNQAVSRSWRMGQVKPVTVYRLIAEGTLEERLYRRNIQKHALAARVLEETQFNRLYTREDLMRFTEADDSSFVPTAVIMNHGVLKALSSSYTLYNHDALFLGDDAELSEEEKCRAINDLYGMRATSQRLLEAPDGTVHVIEPGECFFSDGSLVPSYTPSYTCISGMLIAFDHIGPSPLVDIDYIMLDDGDEVGNWIRNETHPVGHSFVIRMTQPGTFKFRMRSKHLDLVGPWSDESVPITVQED
jgi:SNF2 family DNA or RNA helicase